MKPIIVVTLNVLALAACSGTSFDGRANSNPKTPADAMSPQANSTSSSGGGLDQSANSVSTQSNNTVLVGTTSSGSVTSDSQTVLNGTGVGSGPQVLQGLPVGSVLPINCSSFESAVQTASTAMCNAPTVVTQIHNPSSDHLACCRISTTQGLNQFNSRAQPFPKFQSSGVVPKEALCPNPDAPFLIGLTSYVGSAGAKGTDPIAAQANAMAFQFGPGNIRPLVVAGGQGFNMESMQCAKLMVGTQNLQADHSAIVEVPIVNPQSYQEAISGLVNINNLYKNVNCPANTIAVGFRLRDATYDTNYGNPQFLLCAPAIVQ